MSGRSRTLRVEILGDARDLDRTFDQVERGAGGIGDKLKRGAQIGAVALAGIGIAAGAVAVDSTRAFIGFQNQMNEVFTLLPGITDNAMSEMQRQVLDFSREFGRLPEEVVPALYQSISAGVPPDNVFTFLETAQKAAVGGVTDLAVAVDGISSTINAYGTDVLSATQASDLMFTAVRLGKTTFDELSASLFQVIPTAAALGLEFGNVTAALAAMTAQGVPTSVATTQLRQLLVELSKEGSVTSGVFKEIAGVGFRQFLDQGGNLQDALQLLERHAADTGVGINDLFGSVEAGQAALALTGKGTEAFANALGEMDESAGATDAAFAQMEQGLARNIEKINANIAALRIEIGEKLAPVAVALTDFILDTGIPALERFAEIAGGPLAEGFTLARDAVKTLIEALEGDWTDDEQIHPLHRAIGQIGTVIHEDVIPAVEMILGLFRDIRDFNWSGVQETLRGALSGGLELAEDAGQRIVDGLRDQFEAVDWSEVRGRLRDGIMGGLSSLESGAEEGANRAQGLVDDLATQFEAVDWSAIQGSVREGMLGGLAAAGDAGEEGVNLAQDIVDNLATQFEDVDWSATQAAIRGGISDGLDAAEEGAEEGAGVGQAVIDWIAEGLEEGVDWAAVGTAIRRGIITGLIAVSGGAALVAVLIDTLAQALIDEEGDWSTVGETIWDRIVDGLKGAANIGGQLVGALSAAFTEIDWSSVDFAGMAEGLGAGIESQLREWFGGLDLEAMLRDSGLVLSPEFIDPFIETLSGLRDELDEIAQVLSEDLQPTIDEARKAWEEWEPILRPILGLLAEIVLIEILAFLTGLAGALHFTAEALHIVFGALQGFFEQLRILGDAITTAVGFLQMLWANFMTAVEVGLVISEFVSGVIASLGRMASEGAAKAAEFLDGVLGPTDELAVQGAGKISGMVTGMLESFRNLVDGAVTKVQTLASDALTAIEGFVTDAKDEVASLPGKITAALGDLSGLLYQAGKDIVQGLIDGVNALIPDLEGVFSAITSKIPEWKGPLEHDRQLLQPTGEAIMQGLISGIEREMPAVQERLDAVTDMIEEMGERIKDRWLDALDDLDAIASGEVQADLVETIADLQRQIQAAVEAGAPREVIAELERQLAEAEAQLEAVGIIAGTSVVKGIQHQQVMDGVRAARERIIDEFEAISSESLDALEEMAKKSPELVAGSIKDIIKAAQEGRIPWERAIEILSLIPQDLLLPVLKELEEQLGKDVVEAILDGGEAADEAGRAFDAFQRILDGLGISAEWVELRMRDMEGALWDVEAAGGAVASRIGDVVAIASQIPGVVDNLEAANEAADDAAASSSDGSSGGSSGGGGPVAVSDAGTTDSGGAAVSGGGSGGGSLGGPSGGGGPVGVLEDDPLVNLERLMRSRGSAAGYLGSAAAALGAPFVWGAGPAAGIAYIMAPSGLSGDGAYEWALNKAAQGHTVYVWNTSGSSIVPFTDVVVVEDDDGFSAGRSGSSGDAGGSSSSSRSSDGGMSGSVGNSSQERLGNAYYFYWYPVHPDGQRRASDQMVTIDRDRRPENFVNWLAVAFERGNVNVWRVHSPTDLEVVSIVDELAYWSAQVQLEGGTPSPLSTTDGMGQGAGGMGQIDRLSQRRDIDPFYDPRNYPNITINVNTRRADADEIARETEAAMHFAVNSPALVGS